MTIGNFTKQALEARAANEINTIIRSLGDLALLNDRLDVELSAGTLDTPEFYGGDPNDPAGHPAAPNDKANIVGTYNEAASLYAWLLGGGTVPPPSGDPMAYAKAVLQV